MNPLQGLLEFGQSPWLDYLRRNLIGAELDRLVAEDGLRGITSNPSIFEKAIGQSSDYDDEIAQLASAGAGTAEIYERLTVHDIRMAADALRPTHDATNGRDGFVSLEVSPYLAVDTAQTIEEARHLWRLVDRPNLMVKVPATTEGIPAIETLLGEGININITLLFALDAYDAVAEAYLRGLEHYGKTHDRLDRLASVASFFVSRIDTAVDKQIDRRLADTALPAQRRAALERLHGKIAIANAKLAYKHYQATIASERWKKLAARGAAPQRLLWASTGTKNPAYSDVLYVETLIGPDTVNTLPPATMDAFRDHGHLAPTLTDGMDEAEATLESLAPLGISLDAITTQLVGEGVRLFADAADKLFEAIENKRRRLLGTRIAGMSRRLPPDFDAVVASEIDAWRIDGRIRRLWARDAELWTGSDEARWLGWLDAPSHGRVVLPRAVALAEELERSGIDNILLIGMGGSSLGPEVVAETFAGRPGLRRLRIIDSTDPAQIRAVEAGLDLARTLFIVSSKSGSTLEPNLLCEYFLARATQRLGAAEAARRFVAITDPGSSLAAFAEKHGFRAVFEGDPSIGGRYSVLSPFGIVPAALMGLDVAGMIDATNIMVEACGPLVPPAANPGVQLGVVIGLAGRRGHDKLTLLCGPGIKAFAGWVEQLAAESTGKNGKGLIPVADEPLGGPGDYGKDRLFIHIALADVADPDATRIAALAEAGLAVVSITLAGPEQLGQQFYLWEIATAVAGAILGINPFDQPDVEASKVETRRLTDAFERSGRVDRPEPLAASGDIALFADTRNAKELGGGSAEALVKAHLARLRPGDYAALLAYLPRDPRIIDALQPLRRLIRDRTRAATCVGFGPRFLHSTGQAYKGGPNSGVFTQLTWHDRETLPVPGKRYDFGTVEAAQAAGDFAVLAARGRRLLRIDLGQDLERGLAWLGETIRGALA